MVLTVHVQPRAKRTEVVGWHGDAIKLRLAAPPVGGRANAELLRFLVAQLGVPQGAVRILSGRNGRRKRVRIDGLAEKQVFDSLALSFPGPRP